MKFSRGTIVNCAPRGMARAPKSAPREWEQKGRVKRSTSKIESCTREYNSIEYNVMTVRIGYKRPIESSNDFWIGATRVRLEFPQAPIAQRLAVTHARAGMSRGGRSCRSAETPEVTAAHSTLGCNLRGRIRAHGTDLEVWRDSQRPLQISQRFRITGICRSLRVVARGCTSRYAERGFTLIKWHELTRWIAPTNTWIGCNCPISLSAWVRRRTERGGGGRGAGGAPNSHAEDSVL